MQAVTPVGQRHVFDCIHGNITPEKDDAVRESLGECQVGGSRYSLDQQLFARSVYGTPMNHYRSGVPYTKYLSHLRCWMQGVDEHQQNGPGVGSILCDAIGHRTSPVFAMEFASGALYSNMVALGDEDGYVSIVRADKDIPRNLCDDSSPNRPVGQWRTHKNAVFDLAWANQDRWIYVASGDTNVTLWDTGYAMKISTFSAGRGSVKALSVKPDCHSVFASAGRDGDVYIHDARVRSFCQGDGEFHRKHQPAIRLGGPHSMVDTRSGRNPKFGHSRSAVTALCFLDGPNSSILASGGQDGKVKLWDIRYDCHPIVTHRPLTDLEDSTARSVRDANVDRSIRHISSMAQPALSERARGLTSLSLHPDGTQLLASYIGGQHLIFDVSHPEYGPIQWFGGNLIDSFYVKSSFTPDGTHIVSGSSDNQMYIWSLSDKAGTHPIVLEGHTREVTSVACNPQNPFQIVSAGDDHVVKFWSIHVDQPEEEFQGHDSYKVLQERIQGHTSPSDSRLWTDHDWCHLDTPGYTPRDVTRHGSTSVQRNMSNVLKKAEEGTKKRTSKQITISDMLQKKMRQHKNCK